MQRQLLAAAARAARAPATRSTVQRRFASTSDNAFIREREAAKHHAASTTGICVSAYHGQHIEKDGDDLSFERMQDVIRGSARESGCIPALGLAAANAYVLWNEHWEHWSHLPPLEERAEYSYQNIRTKNFQWGDGDKTIFWNDKVNYHNPDKA
ncbi:putative cytochrome c oxidase subunit VIa [Colletotrichum sublineola]|uniref:Putative cytochrome c oxidase subunit VIa n=1 Tax=Colletotrichum sublineola TaxID=1173701 RepID=A0A066XHP0_COLSU|nr:putative cytochrome c oxidase subunit VIa [Colletotrichum sublineola]